MFEPHYLEAVGPGWKTVLQALGSAFEGVLGREANGEAKIKILQVKEKFGGLRVYIQDTGFSPENHGLLSFAVSFAETMSLLLCEKCGKPAAGCRMPAGQKYGWVKTLCEEHHAERDAKYPARREGL